MNGKIRMPAEWENQSAILMAFPDESTDWAYIIDEARKQFVRLAEAIIQNGGKVIMLARNPEDVEKSFADFASPEYCSLGKSLSIIPMEINDTWTRDYGPVSIIEKDKDLDRIKAVDFGFNAWGLKFASNYDNIVVGRLNKLGIIPDEAYVNRRGFILEGGSLETDGEGTLLTTSECLLNENRNPGYSRNDIEDILSRELGIDRVLWLDYGHIDGDDTDSHIDTLCRFATGNRILYTGSDKGSDLQKDSIKRMEMQLKTFRTREGEAYKLVKLPLPDPIYDENGNPLAATYANYLVMPKAVLMPIYRDAESDEAALRILQDVYPDRKIIGVDCRTLIRQGGSLHCSTMQIYSNN